MKVKGFETNKIILYQDNQRTILLEKNVKTSYIKINLAIKNWLFIYEESY